MTDSRSQPMIWALLSLMVLTGCGERASCWDDKRARFAPCEEVRRDEINREIDRREMERERNR